MNAQQGRARTRDDHREVERQFEQGLEHGGVSQVILSDEGTVQQVRATVPGGEPRRFLRLLVTGN